jgi:2-hydroxy-3-keto-5-methylthiopentenyl-1-phosphate phosphatase
VRVRNRAGPVVMCDFDETIVSPDTGVVILDKFADGDWRNLERLYESNEMSLEEVMRRQFSMVKATKNSMIEEVETSVSFRPGFEELVKTCYQRSVPLIVVSYGLDFCIEHLLEKAGLSRKIKVHSPRTRLDSNGIGLVFPKLRLKGSVNLKDEMVKHYKQRTRKVIYVGDGASDLPAAKAADVRFAIRGSVLARLCEQERVQHSQITSFGPVLRALEGR